MTKSSFIANFVSIFLFAIYAFIFIFCVTNIIDNVQNIEVIEKINSINDSPNLESHVDISEYTCEYYYQCDGINTYIINNHSNVNVSADTNISDVDRNICNIGTEMKKIVSNEDNLYTIPKNNYNCDTNGCSLMPGCYYVDYVYNIYFGNVSFPIYIQKNFTHIPNPNYNKYIDDDGDIDAEKLIIRYALILLYSACLSVIYFGPIIMLEFME